MRLIESIQNVIPDRIRDALNDARMIERSAFGPGNNIRDDIKTKYGYEGDLLDIFVDNKDLMVSKWHHYIPLYDRYFSSFRGKPIRFLEIGVSKGGSRQMWRKYFGNDAIIYGIDIDPECKKFDGTAAQVRIGSQADPDFLRFVVKEMGGVDIVLDDGSHHMKHIPKSLVCLFPLLNKNGIYMIEDLHTSYWLTHGGSYRGGGNFFRVVLALMDGMHRWYHRMGQKYPEVSGACSGIHIHDSIVVLEKGGVYQPVHSQIS